MRRSDRPAVLYKRRQSMGGAPWVPGTVLQMHFEGPNNSTTFIDVCGHTCTAGGSAKLVTAGALIGTSSYSGTNAGAARADIPNSPDFSFGSGDFGCECQLLTNNGSALQFIFNSTASSGRGFVFALNNGRLVTLGYDDSSGLVWNLTGASNITVATRYHVGVFRVGSQIYLTLNGNVDNSATAGGTGTVQPNTNSNAVIGTDPNNAGRSFEGLLDELRVVKGKSPYQAFPFTPPTTAFADS